MDEASNFLPRNDLRVFRAIRKMVRAIELHSRRLSTDFGVTSPQLVCLVTLAEDGPLSNSALAARVYLSPSTVVGILDRLEEKSLVRRERSTADRRVVRLSATEQGRSLVADAPSLLQKRLADAMRVLPLVEQKSIADALERVVALMGADAVEASPFLEAGPLDRAPDADPPAAPARRNPRR